MDINAVIRLLLRFLCSRGFDEGIKVKLNSIIKLTFGEYVFFAKIKFWNEIKKQI